MSSQQFKFWKPLHVVQWDNFNGTDGDWPYICKPFKDHGWYSKFLIFLMKNSVQNNRVISFWENTTWIYPGDCHIILEDLFLASLSEEVSLNVEGSSNGCSASVFATLLCRSWWAYLLLIMLPLASFFYVSAELKSRGLISLKQQFILYFGVLSFVYACAFHVSSLSQHFYF